MSWVAAGLELRVCPGLLCFIESWFIIFPKGWLEGLSTIGSKLYF